MNKENYNQRNVEWMLNCINSCTNNEQLDCCEVLIGLFRFRLLKDKTDEKEIHKIECQIIEEFVNKRALLEII
jgi:hypothetical protein